MIGLIQGRYKPVSRKLTWDKYNVTRFWKISRKLLSVTFMIMIQPGDVCGGKCVYRSESVMILYCSMLRFGTEMIWPYLVK